MSKLVNQKLIIISCKSNTADITGYPPPGLAAPAAIICQTQP